MEEGKFKGTNNEKRLNKIIDDMTLFDDGSHIIYVNGSYKGEGDLAKLIEDFHQKNPANMHYKVLSDGVKHFKEKEEGRETMCDSVEKYAEEVSQERVGKEMSESVKNLMEGMHISMEQAIKLLGLKGTTKDYVLSQLKK